MVNKHASTIKNIPVSYPKHIIATATQPTENSKFLNKKRCQGLKTCNA